MVKIHNSFTISDGNGEEKEIYNEVLLPAAAILNSRYNFAKYIRLHTSKGIFSAPASAVSFNENVLSGPLYCEYTAIFDGVGLKGASVTAFALSPDGVREFNRAECDAAVLSGGEDITVGAKVYLEIALEKCVLYRSAKNALIRILIGMEAFDKSRTYAYWGDSAVLPEFGATPTVSKPRNLLPLKFTATENGISIIFNLPPSACDAVLFINGEPVIRLPAQNFYYESKTAVDYVSPENVLPAGNDTVNRVLSARGIVTGKSYTGIEVLHVPKKFVRAQEETMLSFRESARIITDPEYKTAAFIDEDELFLIVGDYGRLSVAARVKLDGTAAHLTSKNELLRISKNTVGLYGFDAYYGLSKHYAVDLAVPSTGKTAAVRYGDDIIIARETAGGIEIGILNNGAYTVKRIIEGVPLIIARSRRQIVVVTEKEAYCFTGAGNRLTYVEDNIDYFIKTHSVTIDAFNDGLMAISKPDDPSINHVVSIYSGIPMQVPIGEKIELYGDFFGTVKPDGGKRFYYYFRKDKNYVRMEIDGADGIKELSRIGDIILLRDFKGVLSENFIEPGISCLYGHMLPVGEEVSYAYSAFKDIPPLDMRAEILIE